MRPPRLAVESHNQHDRFPVILIDLVGIVSALVLVTFFAACLSVPGDGTQVIFPLSGYVRQGLPVEASVPMADGLRQDDAATST